MYVRLFRSCARSVVGASRRADGVALPVLGRLIAGPGRPRVARPAARRLRKPRRLPATRGCRDAAAPAAADAALVQKYCVTCHNARAKTGGLSLDGDVARRRRRPRRDLGEGGAQAARRHDAAAGHAAPRRGDARGASPPRSRTSLDAQARQRPDPGHKPVHRLNRTEYGNAVRDLLDLEIDVADLLPADDESHGFDNIAGVLRVSPSLLEQYLAAARKISSLAVGTDTDLVRLAFRIPPDDSQEDHVDGLPLGTRGGLLFRHTFPQDAEYDFSVFLLRNIVGYMTGLEFAHTLEISVDGERVFTAQVGGEEDNLASDTNMSEAANAIDERLKTRVPVTAGPHDVGVTFVRRNHAESDEPLQPHERNHDLQDMNGLPLIDYVNLTGPFNATGPGDTPSRRRIFTCRPAQARADDGGLRARRSCSALARRAYRRPVTAADLAPVLAQYAAGRAKRVVRARHRARAAADPRQPEVPLPDRGAGADRPAVGPRVGPRAGVAAVVLPVELASRRRAADAAARGQLSQPAVLERRCGACCAIPRSRALVDNFASQWLMLRNLQGPHPDARRLPRTSTTSCARRFRRETELFFDSIIREDRSVLDLLTADYTFVNERLARHYGIPNVYGSHFRRVTLPDETRRGLLGQGSILTVTSYPEPHVAGAARQVDPREHPRHAAAAAAAQRARARREQGRRGAQVAARAAGAAPPHPGVRQLPPRDGSARLRARELRRHRRVARQGSRRRDRSDGPAGRRQRRSTARWRCGRR